RAGGVRAHAVSRSDGRGGGGVPGLFAGAGQAPHAAARPREPDARPDEPPRVRDPAVTPFSEEHFMSDRTFHPRSPTGLDLAGDLKPARYRHARERANHFFYYLFLMKVLVNRLNAKVPALALRPDEGVDVAATEQIDTGFRRGSMAEYHRFDNTSPGMVNENS